LNVNLRLPFCLAWLCVLLVTVSDAAPVKLESMQVGSRTYRNVTVLGFNETDVYFTHAGGIANAKLRALEPELQKMFNFNPQVAAEAERRQAEENVQFMQQVEREIVTDHQQKRVAARRAELTHDASLADPLSEKSIIAQKLPEWKVDRWIGAKPELRERPQLIYLWAPWSLASRKFMPEMNKLHEKFEREVAFISLVSEPGSDPETEAGVRADFATAIDSGATLLKKLEITALPQVVVVDAKGIVRYFGHPGALNEQRLKELLAKFVQ
jgi:thiol-disulfide isomerase/thioredoxin